MSFGYGIGDAIAVVNLLERVIAEVRNYRDAPRHFQNLGLGLQLLQRALQRLLEVDPCDESGFQQLEQIKAIAMHCRQPLLSFIDKMRPSETSLGLVRTTETLSATGKRLHWSLITRKDVDELRQVVVSEMVAINMLLAVQQLDSLKLFVSSRNDVSSSSEQLQEFRSVSRRYFTASMEILNQVGSTSASVNRLQEMMSRRLADQERGLEQARDDVSTVSLKLSAFTIRAQSISTILKSTEGYLIRVLRATVSTAEDIGRMVAMLSCVSKRITTTITSQG